MSTLPEDPDNDGFTQYYAIRYPKPGESVRLAQQQLEALAVTVDSALRSIAVEFGPAASKAYVDDQVARATPPGNVRVRMVGNRVAQVVEERPDGTKNTGTFNYTNDALSSITYDNPVRTVTFANGWVVS